MVARTSVSAVLTMACGVLLAAPALLADEKRSQPDPVRQVMAAVRAQAEIVEILDNPVLAGQLAIQRIKEIALKSRKPELGVGVLRAFAERTPHPALKRSAAFAISEVLLRAEQPAEAAEVLLPLAGADEGPRAHRMGSQERAERLHPAARKLAQWRREHPDLARKILQGRRGRPGPGRPMGPGPRRRGPQARPPGPPPGMGRMMRPGPRGPMGARGQGMMLRRRPGSIRPEAAGPRRMSFLRRLGSAWAKARTRHRRDVAAHRRFAPPGGPTRREGHKGGFFLHVRPRRARPAEHRSRWSGAFGARKEATRPQCACCRGRRLKVEASGEERRHRGRPERDRPGRPRREAREGDRRVREERARQERREPRRENPEGARREAREGERRERRERGAREEVERRERQEVHLREQAERLEAMARRLERFQRELQERAERLEQRERELDHLAEKLEARARELREREQARRERGDSGRSRERERPRREGPRRSREERARD